MMPHGFEVKSQTTRFTDRALLLKRGFIHYYKLRYNASPGAANPRYIVCTRAQTAGRGGIEFVWIEVLDGDYRFILAGEDVRWLFGRSIKDLRLSQIRFTNFVETTWQQYDTAVASGQPCCSIGSYQFSHASSYRVGGTVTRREIAMLPFRNADGAVDRLLAGMAFDTPGPGGAAR